jgi:hypothetical protein
MGREKNLARRQERQTDTVCTYGLLISPALSGGVGKSMKGGDELRYLGRGSAWIGTGPSTAMFEGFLASLSPSPPARPESHKSIAQVSPSRRAPADELGCSTPSLQVEHAPHCGD